MFDWYRILSESVDIGVMIYDQSWRVGLGTTLTPPLIERLSGLDNIVSLKYGSPNLIKDMPVVIDRFADRFAFIDNSLGFTSVSSHMHGATGYISGPVTWWPEFELSFFDLMERGRYAEADRWHARLAPYMAWHHGEHWKSGRYVFDAAVVKASLEYVGSARRAGAAAVPGAGRGGEGGAVGDYRGDRVGAAGRSGTWMGRMDRMTKIREA